ncbi:hypothetical protein ANCDUO_03297 [Ancylostoma duodenale]|uniref:Uncharacterized protein n=1 Tax=Ancylostoma duodenale TaxID=51022 RepID=A0A0C2GY04_9BILA|nr:hypothetical protein ANCDUO_03297 [Ancylostoma duodenale]
MSLLVSQCSAKAVAKSVRACGDNETFDMCGMKECDPKCKMEQNYEGDDGEEEEPDAECLSYVCAVPGDCVCNKGYYRNKKDQCVTEDECQEDFMDFIKD